VACGKWPTDPKYSVLEGNDNDFKLRGLAYLLEKKEDPRSNVPSNLKGRSVCDACCRLNIKKNEELNSSLQLDPSTSSSKQETRQEDANGCALEKSAFPKAGKPGRPRKSSQEQSDRTRQNKIALFRKDVKRLEKKYEVDGALTSQKSIAEKLGLKLPTLLRSLPPISPFRRFLIKTMAEGEERFRDIGRYLGISTQTIKASASATLKAPLKYWPKVKREKISLEQRKKIEDFWHDHTYPIPWKKTVISTGSKAQKVKLELPYYVQHDTDQAITSKFFSQTGLKFCSSTLLKYKPKDIHHASQKYCVCHHCKEGQDAKEKLRVFRTRLHKNCAGCPQDESCDLEQNLVTDVKEELGALKEEVKSYLEHKKIADHQADKLVEFKENLREGECLVVEDFAGRFLIKAELELSQEDFFARKGVPDLVIFAYFKKGSILEHRSFDILAKTSEKDDFAYLRSSWIYLLNQTDFFDGFQKIIIFSDGGPKHFKIRKSLFFFSLLSCYYEQEFEWNFFQSCHGKGPCDAHVGYIKRCLKREVKKNLTISSEKDFFHFSEGLSKVNPILIEIDREKNWDCSEMRQGIKKFFSFRFTRRCGEILCFEKTGDQVPVIQHVTSNFDDMLPFHEKQRRRPIPMELE